MGWVGGTKYGGFEFAGMENIEVRGKISRCVQYKLANCCAGYGG